MPEKSYSGIGISSDSQFSQSGIGIPASGSVGTAVTDNKVKAIRQAAGRQQQVNRQESVKTAGRQAGRQLTGVLQAGRRLTDIQDGQHEAVRNADRQTAKDTDIQTGRHAVGGKAAGGRLGILRWLYKEGRLAEVRLTWKVGRLGRQANNTCRQEDGRQEDRQQEDRDRKTCDRKTDCRKTGGRKTDGRKTGGRKTGRRKTGIRKQC